MVISHRYRFVFVEVPHTGTHSISEQLCEHYGGQKILRKHANLSQFWHAASREERRYFKLATVRDPLDTAVTDYFKLKSNHRGQFTNPDLLLANGGHVTEQHLREFRFVHDDGADFQTFFRRFRNRTYNNWFLLGDGLFDYVLRFERLAEQYLEVLERLGVDTVHPLPHRNPTKLKQTSFADHYATPEVREQAVRCYGPFMRKWGYDFPSEWGPRRVPMSSLLRFAVEDRAANATARVVALDPDAPHVRRIKSMVDALT